MLSKRYDEGRKIRRSFSIYLYRKKVVLLYCCLVVGNTYPVTGVQPDHVASPCVDALPPLAKVLKIPYSCLFFLLLILLPAHFFPFLRIPSQTIPIPSIPEGPCGRAGPARGRARRRRPGQPHQAEPRGQSRDSDTRASAIGLAYRYEH